MILLHGWPAIAATWKHQLECFGSLGFYVVAPDMPGYGRTWTSKDPSDFALEKLVPQFIDLLHHLGRQKAIWFGHDWGSGPLWAIASHHPDVCEAIISMSVPYRTLELGLKELLRTVDRDLYPESKYPYGQWDYQVFYETDPQASDRHFESNVPRFVKLIFSKSRKENARSVAATSDVSKNGGWFGGPSVEMPDLPLENTLLDQNLFEQLTESLTKNGLSGATAYYLNHSANEQYSTKEVINNGKLKMPVLFIHTEYDAIAQTVHNEKTMTRMRADCENLQEFTLKAGHWGMLERPTETNAGVVEWLIRAASHLYPGPQLVPQK